MYNLFVMGIFKKKNTDEVVSAIKKAKLSKSEKYNKGLKTSRENFTRRFLKLATKYRKVNSEYFVELEELLIMADVGVQFTMSLINSLKEEAKLKNIQDPIKMNELIFNFLFKQYSNKKNESVELNLIDNELNVILVMGVNGVGKTTTIGKLTKRLKDEGKNVVLAAADTFRAGAVAQLKIWAERTNCEIVTPSKDGQDPASVVYQGLEKSKDINADVLIVDTAGRLQNKEGLMRELSKISQIIERSTGKPPIESLLVLDATTGQNGVIQAESFNDIANLTGIILTKMDSSAKGGIILSIKHTFNIPVKFIGLGESLDDLEVFDIKEYLRGLTMGMIENVNE
ncbi:MAG: signal recognition particle receptor FtsY [Candidatus Tyloplasma litorale]|nr:MAG: signal recognition particle receptor FtsY [Mycoplasmatales bacterium]